MTFPSVIGSAAVTQVETAAPVSLNMPSGIIAGELLIAICSGDTDGTITSLSGGWSTLTRDTYINALTATVFAKVAAGSDTLDVSFEANDLAAVVFRVTGHGVTDPLSNIAHTSASGIDFNPAPPNCSSGAFSDHLWIEAFAASGHAGLSGYASNGYTGIAKAASALTASACMVAAAYKAQRSESEFPSVMATNAKEEYIAYTLAIPPLVNSGQVSSTSQGSLAAADHAIALTGTVSTLSAGNMAYHPSSLSGQSVSVGQGTLTFSTGSGQRMTMAQGTMIPGVLTAALNAGAITTASGTVNVTGNNPVTVHLSGVEAATSVGTITIGPVLLTGSTATFAAGSMVQSKNVPLVGSQSVLTPGVVTPNLDADDARISCSSGLTAAVTSVPLIGSAAIFATGALDPRGKEVALTTSISTLGQGSMVAAPKAALTGQAITSAQEPFGAPGLDRITGISIPISQQSVLYALSAPLSGSALTSASGTMVGSKGGLTLTGQVITTSQQGIGPRTVAMTGLSLNVDQGTIRYRDNSLIGTGITMSQGTFGIINTGIPYVEVDDEQGNGFSPVDDAQGSGWTEVNKSQTPGWTQ